MSHNDSSPDNTRTTLDETKSGTEFANLQQQHEAASPNPALPNNNNDNNNNDKTNHKKNIPKLASIPSHREAEEMFLAALGGRNEIAADDANNENDSFTVTPRKIRQSINMSNLNNNGNNINDDTRSQFTTRSTRSMGGLSSQRGGDFASGPQNFDYAALSSIMAQGNDTQLAATAGMSQSRSVLSKAREGTLSVERVGGNYGCELVIVKARKGAGEAEEGSDAGFGDDDVDDDFSDTTSRIGGGTDSVFGEYSPNIRRSVGGRLGNEGDAGTSPQRQQNNIMNDAEAEAKFRAQQELFKQQSRRYSDAPQGLIEVANDFSMVKKKGSQQDQSLAVARTAEENNQSEQIMLARRLGQQALSPSNQQIRKQGSSVASFGNHQDQVVASASPPSAVMLEAMKFVEETKKKAAEKRAKELQLQQQEDELQQERNRSVETQLPFAAEEGDNNGESAVKLSLDKLKAHNQQQSLSVENNNNNTNDYDENAEVPLSALAKPKQPLDAKSAVSRKSVKIIVKRVPKKSKEGVAAANKNDDEIQDQEDVGVIEASPENNNQNGNEESSPSARNPTSTDDSNENNSTSISQQQQSNDESSPTASKTKQEKSQKSKQLDDDDVQSIISRATAKGTKIIVVKKVSKNKSALSAAGPNSAKLGTETADADAEKPTIEENDNNSNNNKVEENDEQSQLLQQPAITVSTSATEFAMIQKNETNTKIMDQDEQEIIESASSPEAKNPEANQSEKNKQIQEQPQANENQISPRITEGISGTIVGGTTSNTITNNNNNNNPNNTPRFSTGSVLHSKSRHSMGKSKPPAIEPTGDSAHVSISICEGSLHPEHKNYRNAEDFEQDNLLRTQDLDDERERIDREDIANHFAKAVVRNGEGNNINSSRHGSMKFLSSSNQNNDNIADDHCSGKSTPETTTDEAKPASAPAILNSSNNNNNITSASSSSNLDNNAGSKKENDKAENDGVVDDDVSKNYNSNNDKIGENQQDEARIPLAEFLHLKKPKNAKNRAKVLLLPSPDSSSKFLIDPSKSKSLAPLGIYEPNCSKCHTKSYPPPPHWKCAKTQSGKNCGGLTWQPDQNFCTFCNVEFTFFTRHHHCYLCGKSACDECTAQKECLPSEAWNDQQTGEKVWNLSDPSAKFRCCKLCFKRKSFDFLPSAVQKKKQVEAAAAAATSSSSSSPSTNLNSLQKNLKQVPISPPTFVASHSSFKLIPVSEFGEEHDEQHQVVETETKSKKDDDNDEQEVTRSRIKFVLDETALPSALRKKREDEDKGKQKLSQETDRLYLNDKDDATVRVFFSEIDETFSFSDIRNFDDLFQLEMEHRRLIKEIRKREVVTVNNCYLHHGVVNGLFRGMMERFAQIEEKVRQQDEKQSQQQQPQKKNEKKNSDGDKKKNFPVPGCTIGNFPIMEATKDILSFTGSPKFDVDEISIFGDDFEAVFASRTSMLTRHEEELQNANKELKMNANRLKKMEGCCAF